jgi:hypothetical protein
MTYSPILYRARRSRIKSGMTGRDILQSYTGSHLKGGEGIPLCDGGRLTALPTGHSGMDYPAWWQWEYCKAITAVPSRGRRGWRIKSAMTGGEEHATGLYRRFSQKAKAFHLQQKTVPYSTDMDN